MRSSELTAGRLRTFLAVARCGTFTAAASEVHLSRSAAWRQIDALESVLSAPLFERIGRAVTLTDAGRAFRVQATRIIGDIDRAEEAVRAAEQGRHGRIRIDASTTPGFYLIPEILGRFRARHPEFEIGFAIANTKRIGGMIEANEIDLGFVGGEIQGEDLLIESPSRTRSSASPTLETRSPGGGGRSRKTLHPRSWPCANRAPQPAGWS